MYIIRSQYNGHDSYLTPYTFRDGALVLRVRWTLDPKYAKVYVRRSAAEKAAERWGGNVEIYPSQLE